MNKKFKKAISGVVMSGVIACGMFTGLVCRAVPEGDASEETVTPTLDNVYLEEYRPLARMLNYDLNTFVECYKRMDFELK